MTVKYDMTTVKYDHKGDAVYVKLAEGAEYGEMPDDYRVIHYDANDEIVAVEFLFISKGGLNLEGLPPEVAQALQALRAATPA